ncbi:MAG: Flp pilus assembly complex ATPase component TadA, partial [Planctomycetaceae bacterium]|nr:Flp pilus assembly complex ATPase component TadA [Planctomycetaceae bacterium]
MTNAASGLYHRTPCATRSFSPDGPSLNPTRPRLPISQENKTIRFIMTQPIESRAPAFLSDLHPTDERFAVQAVEKVIEFAQASKASDIHFLPGAEPGVLDILQRVDGVLQPVGSLPRNGQNVISRLKVLSNLLTYRTDVPQEGRIRDTGESVEMRVSTFPTVHGEKAVVRLFVGSGEYRFLSDLELPTTIED